MAAVVTQGFGPFDAARLLAAIQLWAIERLPQVRALHPVHPAAGEPVMMLGRGFGEGLLEARFGPVPTWALALRDGLAMAIAPAGAGAPLALFRRAWTAAGDTRPSSAGGGPTRVERVDPAEGAEGVLRDAPVVLRFSRPLAPPAEQRAALRVVGPGGAVDGRTWSSPDRRVLIWGCERPLAPGEAHSVEAFGLRDHRGEPVEDHRSGFSTGPLTLEEMLLVT